MAHQAGAYPCFCSMKRLEVFFPPPGWDASQSEDYPQHEVCWYPYIHVGGERHSESKVSFPRTHHNVAGQGSNLNHSIWGQDHCQYKSVCFNFSSSRACFHLTVPHEKDTLSLFSTVLLHNFGLHPYHHPTEIPTYNMYLHIFLTFCFSTSPPPTPLLRTFLGAHMYIPGTALSTG